MGKLFLIPSFVSLHFKFTSYHHVCSKSTPYSGLWPPCWLAEQDCSYRGRWRSSQAFAEEPRRYRCYSMPPNSIHQGRKGRVQRHSCGRYASRRIQITHRTLEDLPCFGRGYCCWLCSATRWWCNGIPSCCFSGGVPCFCCGQELEQTVLFWPTGLRGYCKCY